jgi:hypothetical protein
VLLRASTARRCWRVSGATKPLLQHAQAWRGARLDRRAVVRDDRVLWDASGQHAESSRAALLRGANPPAAYTRAHKHAHTQPPFGMPHVNPTIETWGAGDTSKPYVMNEVESRTVLRLPGCARPGCARVTRLRARHTEYAQELGLRGLRQ